MMFKPIKKTRVYEEIVAKVTEMINNGVLKEGDQLPGERELAETFSVSRSSLREALRTLESQGFLESRQGNGTYVASQPVELLVKPFASVILSEKDAQSELFEMRRLIEPQVAYLAAERATSEEIDQMEKILADQESQVAGGGTGTDVDKAFHYALAEATKNRILLRMMDAAMEFFSESRDNYLQIKGRPEKSLVRHKEMLNAIKAGNKKRAAGIMREHLEDIESSLFEVKDRKISAKSVGRSSSPAVNKERSFPS
ncbi:MAG TPA: FadR family transcriptional regulator [Proteobacteria bacterium]|nr:HTH-type transcriptional regulator LutR [bacterium BMS3Abin14]HDL52348.1 FadR family transcriptional regulator [Pseudomonadota bacterium]